MSSSDIAFLDATAQAELVRTKQVSAAELVDGEGFAWWGERSGLEVRRKAIQSFRLRLHSGLQQRGNPFMARGPS